jgi:hypothetical protein
MGFALSNGTLEYPSIMEQAGKPVLDNGTRYHIVQQSRTVQPELISDLTNFMVVRSRIISNKKPPQMEVF